MNIPASLLRSVCWFATCALVVVSDAALPSSQPAGVLAQGTAAETPFYVNDSGLAGPVVMIIGGVHGDEPAGAYAADQIRHWPIARGKMIVVPRANVVALEARKRLTPGSQSELANLNRNFAKAGQPEPPRGELAAALWALVQETHPDWLLDLHEGFDFNRENSASVGSSVIAFPSADAETVVALMLDAVNATIADTSRHFTRRMPPIDGSLARAAGEHLGIRAMILETTSKAQPLSKRARQHRLMVQACLKHLGTIDESVTPEWLTDRNPTPARINVALYDADGSAGAGVPRVLEQLGQDPHTSVTCVGAEDILRDALRQFRVVVFTGGSGSKQAAPLGEVGRGKIKEFVENGGGYVGICAGSYLACSGFPWGVKILDAKTKSSLWQRGEGTVMLELTDRGKKVFGERTGTFDCKYANGPILAPGEINTLPDFEPLAFFRTELAEHNSPPGIMVNSPAIVAGECGKGRVLCSSPHPEQTAGLESFIPRAVKWVAQADSE